MTCHVELIEYILNGGTTGIGRYTRELYRHLAALPDQVEVEVKRFATLPGAQRFSALQRLPIGVLARRHGSIAHFVQIMERWPLCVD